MKVITISAILVTLACAVPASAGWYGAGDVIGAAFQGPEVDGTWMQKKLQSQRGIPAVRQTKEAMGWDIGAGYRFADGEPWYSKLISIEAGYRHYGSGVSAGGLAISDAAYTEILNGANPGKYRASEYEATTHMEGGYLRVAKGFDVGYGLEPYVSGGVEVLYQETDFWNKSRPGKIQTGGFTGIMVIPTIGGGLKYEIGNGVKLRAGAEFHQGVSEGGHPVSSRWVTGYFGVEVPFAVFASGAGSARDYLWQR